MSIQVWDARPIHYPPTCRIDKILLGIIESMNPINALGRNVFEFSNPKFPHVSALLNPQHHSASFPVTAAIVTVSKEQVIEGKSADQLGNNPCFDSGKSS
jgi:hypothetical protein